MKRIILIAVACFAVPGCSKNGAEEAVRASLKDPDSARFGTMYYNPKTKRGCLTVNAKNSMGGYTGDQQAYIHNESGSWEVLSTADTDLAGCKGIWADAEPDAN